MKSHEVRNYRCYSWILCDMKMNNIWRGRRPLLKILIAFNSLPDDRDYFLFCWRFAVISIGLDKRFSYIQDNPRWLSLVFLHPAKWSLILAGTPLLSLTVCQVVVMWRRNSFLLSPNGNAVSILKHVSLQ